MKWLIAILRALGLAARAAKDVKGAGDDFDKAAAAADAASKIGEVLGEEIEKK